MNKLTRLAQGFGIGRVVCLLLLVALVALRIWDPPPLKASKINSNENSRTCSSATNAASRNTDLSRFARI